MKYVLVQAIKAQTMWWLFDDCFMLIHLNMNLLTLVNAYKLQAFMSEGVVVDGHGWHTTLHFGVKAKENQDKVPT